MNLEVYRSDTKFFVGIRSKVGRRYLFNEFHGDTGPSYEAANPFAAICE